MNGLKWQLLPHCAHSSYTLLCFIVYMDPTFVWSYETSQTNEEEAKDDHNRAMQAVAATLICAGAKESHLAHIQNRLPSRLYLCCPQLLPNPHINTPWQALYRSRNNHTYITMMGFDELWSKMGRC